MTSAPVSITIKLFDENSLKLSVPFDEPRFAAIRQLPQRQWNSWFIPKELPKQTVDKVYSNACLKLGIDNQGGIHSLRYSFATHLLEHGVDLWYIQKLLGHSSSKTTEIFTYLAAHKIIEICSPIAGLLKTTEGSNDEL